jgi:hypothetical protein
VLYTFGPPEKPKQFCLDENGGLTKEGTAVKISPACRGILVRLVRQPGIRLSNQDLSVGEAKGCIRKLRDALEDDAIINERNLGYYFN